MSISGVGGTPHASVYGAAAPKPHAAQTDEDSLRSALKEIQNLLEDLAIGQTGLGPQLKAAYEKLRFAIMFLPKKDANVRHEARAVLNKISDLSIPGGQTLQDAYDAKPSQMNAWANSLGNANNTWGHPTAGYSNQLTNIRTIDIPALLRLM